MLKQLKVVNFKLIKDLDVSFGPGFNAITGETGAGKSMLLGAISLIMGDRAQKNMLRSEGKTIVEAIWQVSKSMIPWFSEQDLDFDELSIVRREIGTNGKSRIFINDTPVTAQVIKAFTEAMVDVHGQFDNSRYFDTGKQLEVLDAFAENAQELEDYAKVFRAYQQKKNTIEALEKEIQEISLQKDFDEFLLNELIEADLKESESISSIEREIEKADQWHDFQRVYADILDGLDQELGPLSTVQRWLKELQKLHASDELSSILLNVSEELADVQASLNKQLNEERIDEENIAYLRERINVLNALLYKHKLQDVDELLAKKQELELKSHDFEHKTEQLEQLKVSIEEDFKRVKNAANKLSEKRHAATHQFCEEVSDVLNRLSMPNAGLNIKLEATPYNKIGADQCLWMVKTVKGSDFLPMKNVASGGEMSRILLAIKCVLAKKSALATLILDEADTGVSGQVAIEIGSLLQEMGKHTQIIGISHLPQVAAKASHHVKMFKIEAGNTEITDAKALNATERIKEISEMLAGKNAGAEAVDNARILLS